MGVAFSHTHPMYEASFSALVKKQQQPTHMWAFLDPFEAKVCVVVVGVVVSRSHRRTRAARWGTFAVLTRTQSAAGSTHGVCREP
jgi:hypothetical protein